MVNALSTLLGAAGRSALDLILPVYCLGCGGQGEMLCPSCALSLPRLELPFCDVCAAPGVVGLCSDCRGRVRASSGSITGIRAPFLMEGLVRDAVHAFKYRNCRIAAACLGRLMADYLEENPMPGDALAPVPLHPKKLRERGYNQAELLAREIGKITGLPVETGLLVRTRHTLPQARSGGPTRRRDNMAGAFDCGSDVSGRSLILVDDVCTTGSTLNACGEALLAAGASSVWGLVLARERMAFLSGLP